MKRMSTLVIATAFGFSLHGMIPAVYTRTADEKFNSLKDLALAVQNIKKELSPELSKMKKDFNERYIMLGVSYQTKKKETIDCPEKKIRCQCKDGTLREKRGALWKKICMYESEFTRLDDTALRDILQGDWSLTEILNDIEVEVAQKTRQSLSSDLCKMKKEFNERFIMQEVPYQTKRRETIDGEEKKILCQCKDDELRERRGMLWRKMCMYESEITNWNDMVLGKLLKGGWKLPEVLNGIEVTIANEIRARADEAAKKWDA